MTGPLMMRTGRKKIARKKVRIGNFALSRIAMIRAKTITTGVAQAMKSSELPRLSLKFKSSFQA